MILDFSVSTSPLYLDISYLEDYRGVAEVPQTARRGISVVPEEPVIRLNSTTRFKCCFHASNLSRLFLTKMKNLLVIKL